MFRYLESIHKSDLTTKKFKRMDPCLLLKYLETQFQMFIKSRFILDDEYEHPNQTEYVDMTRNKFLQYTRLDIPEFRDTLIQHMESVKKSIGERAQHKMEYESRLSLKATEDRIKEQDTSSRSGNDAHVDDAEIRPIYDEEPMAEVQMTADDNVSATGQQHTEQPEFINEGEVDQNAEQCHDICPLPAKLTDDKTTELSNQSLESENVCLKKTVAQKTFASSTTKVESEPPNGSNADIPNQCESEQALNVSAGTLLSTADQASVFMAMMSVHISSGLVLHQMTSDHNRSELGIQDHSNEQSSSKLVPKVVP
ncbi:hypothetical protein Tco_0884750 [Tanacetum coccineum]